MTLKGNAMRTRILTAVAVAALVGLTTSVAFPQQDIRWGTPPVGTAGHKAMVTLANLLNKEMPKYRISVLPTAGAIATVKGFATKELDGYYGSDVAFHELASDSADSGVLVEHHRGRPGGACPQQGQDQEMG
jgi:TRAP-type uncharacterized transport system substrate-binding protein